MLRNRLGIADVDTLRVAENDLLEVRLAELREHPESVARTYDLEHLKALHRHLFQDVYDWAGELRTVGLAKGGGESFIPPLDISRPVAQLLAESGHGLEWRRIEMGQLHTACHIARNENDPAPLTEIFRITLTDMPGY